MASKRKIIMDCDPGIDDSFALAFAAANQDSLEVLGITTVAGNLPLETTTDNALRLSAFFGMKDVPVARGSKIPLMREPVTVSGIHGANGLGGVAVPDTDKVPASDNAVLFIKQLIDRVPEGEKVTLVPIGPFTNIALLFRVFPEVKERIEEIVLMGGACEGGNITMSAEFNVFEDPEAAAIVFSCGLPIVMCGLDATEKGGLRAEDKETLMQSGGPVARAFAQMLEFYAAHENPSRVAGITCIHDVSTIMYILHPEVYKAVKMPVKVDCSEGFNRGNTVCDTRVWAHEDELTTKVLMDTDTEKFREYLMEALLALDKKMA